MSCRGVKNETNVKKTGTTPTSYKSQWWSIQKSKQDWLNKVRNQLLLVKCHINISGFVTKQADRTWLILRTVKRKCNANYSGKVMQVVNYYARSVQGTKNGWTLQENQKSTKQKKSNQKNESYHVTIYLKHKYKSKLSLIVRLLVNWHHELVSLLKLDPRRIYLLKALLHFQMNNIPT
jgi:hypothetical protein